MTELESNFEGAGHPVMRELQRIFGDSPEPPKHWVMLPLVNEQEAIAFLRTVPAGITHEQLVQLALAFRQMHPAVAELVDDNDPDQAL